MRPFALCVLAAALPVLSRSLPMSAIEKPALMRRFDLETMDLEELQPTKAKASLAKRADALDLQSSLSLLWSNSKTQATLSADFSGDNENVIKMDDFADVVSAVDCTPPELSLDFVDQLSFEAAVEKWSWVNEQDVRHFIMVLDMPQCGATSGWVPYNITQVRYDTSKWIAYLRAEEMAYEDVIHDGRLVLATTGSAAASGLESGKSEVSRVHDRAAISKDIDIGHDFSGGIVSGPADGAPGVSLECTNCTTSGDIGLKLEVDIRWFKLKTVSVELTANNVVADVNLALGGHMSQSITGMVELWSLDALGVSIPGIARLGFGPAVGVAWNATVGGTGKLSWGARGSLTPTSTATVCFKGCDTGSDGWNVTWATQTPVTNGTLSASVDVSTYVELTAGASLFGLSYMGGVALVAPDFSGTVTGISDPAGKVCGGDNATVAGIDTSVRVGAASYGFLGQNHVKTDARWDFFSVVAPLYHECFPMAGGAV